MASRLENIPYFYELARFPVRGGGGGGTAVRAGLGGLSPWLLLLALPLAYAGYTEFQANKKKKKG